MTTDYQIKLLNVCQTGDIEAAKTIISTLKCHEISCHDSNGMTPLQYAVSNNREGIIKLLVGRCCALADKDNDGKTAFDFATTPSVKQMLFDQNKIRSRYSRKPEFFSTQAFGLWRYIVNPYRLVECGYYEKEGVNDRRQFVLEWIKSVITHEDEKDLIINYFKTAFAEDSAKPMFIALTEETSFYSILMDNILNEPESRTFDKDEMNGPLLIARNLFKGIYDGKHGENCGEEKKELFAKCNMTRPELTWFKDNEGKILSLKIFWSLTKNRSFAQKMPGNVTFTLTCQEDSTQRTMCLDRMSGYPYEEEVIMAPMTRMKIMCVKRLARSEHEIHISYWDW